MGLKPLVLFNFEKVTVAKYSDNTHTHAQSLVFLLMPCVPDNGISIHDISLSLHLTDCCADGLPLIAAMLILYHLKNKMVIVSVALFTAYINGIEQHRVEYNQME